jgi:hypothetical protein
MPQPNDLSRSLVARGGPVLAQERQLHPTKPTTRCLTSIGSSVPTADVQRASPKPPQSDRRDHTHSACAPTRTTTGRGRHSEPAWDLLPVDKRGWMNYIASVLEKVCVNRQSFPARCIEFKDDRTAAGCELVPRC